MKAFSVCALGESLIDFTPCGKSSKGMPVYECNPGGAVANVLAAVNKLGGKGAFIGKVGDDTFGRFLTDNMKAAGINLKGLCIDREIPTTLAFVSLNSSGDRSFSFYRKPGADIMLSVDDIDRSILSECDIFHFGSVSLTDDPARTATLESAKEAKRNGAVISYDPNYRPLLWKSTEEACKIMKEGAYLADIIKVSDEELQLITGSDSLEEGADLLMETGASIVFVSMGQRGSFVKNETASVRLNTYDVKTVDTTGAGDAFLGSVLSKLHGMSCEKLSSLSEPELWDILDYGNAAGALTTAKTGAAPAIPTDEEIEICRKTVGKLVI